jgi:hypothetical protein
LAQRLNFGEVYFIQGVDGGPVKIGVALNPEKRFRTIQSCSPVLLCLLRTIPARANTEKELHERFADRRLHGEWFEDSILEDLVFEPNRTLVCYQY